MFKIKMAIAIYVVLIAILKFSSIKWQSKLLVKIYRVSVFVLVLGVLCILILSFLILTEVNSEVDNNMSYDYLIILGAGLEKDRVSERLKIRLDTAIEIIKHNKTTIIVSGGQGPNEEITEAEAMYRYLVEHGIPKNRIIKEEVSTSTQENIKLSNTLMKVDDPNVIIVTSDYHMYRSKMLGRRIGWNVYGQSGINEINERIKQMIREVFALAKDILIKKY